MKKNKISFHAILEGSDPRIDAVYVSIPFDVEKIFGTKGQVKVKATFDGHPYRGSLANMGTGCHIIGVRKEIRQAISKNVGDHIRVTIEKDSEKRVVEVPIELRKILNKNPKVKSFFGKLSYTNQKEYAQWITSAKKQETKENRLSLALIKLHSGKRNPSEK
jgi:hypothetical protein